MPEDKTISLKDQVNKAFAAGNVKIDPRLYDKQNSYIGTEAPTLGESKYDTNVPVSIAEEGDLTDLRAQKQSKLDRVANAVPRLVSKVGTEIAKTPAYLYAVGEASMTDKNLAQSLDNAWLNTLDNLDSKTKEQFAIYTPNSVKNGSLWDNITSTSFWTNEGVDGAGFLLSMMVPGAALKSLGMASKLSKLGVAANTAKNMELGTATLMNTTLEAAAEAKGLVDNLKPQLIQKMEAGEINTTTNKPWTQEDIDNTLGEAGKGSFLTNMALIAGPNFLMNKNLLGRFTPTKNTLNKVVDEAGKFIPINPLTRKEIVANYAKEIGKGLFSEGFVEEAGQFAIEDYYTKLSKGETKEGLISGLADSYANALTSTEGQKAIFLGGFFGSGAAIRGAQELKAEKNYTTKLSNVLQKNFEGFSASVADIYQKNDKGEIVLDKNNEPVINTNKAARLAYNISLENKSSAIKDVYALMGNKEAFDYISNQEFTRFVLPYIQEEGGLNVLEKHIDMLSSKMMEQKKASGEIDNTIDEHQYIFKQKEKAKQLQKVYNQVDSFVNTINIPTTEKTIAQLGAFLDKVKNTAFQETSKQLYLSDRIENLSNEVLQLEMSSAKDLPQVKQEVKKLKDQVEKYQKAKEESIKDYELIFDQKEQEKAFSDFVNQNKQVEKHIEEVTKDILSQEKSLTNSIVDKITKGEPVTIEEQQHYDNNPEEIEDRLKELPTANLTIDENPETINQPYTDGDPNKTSIYTTEGGLDVDTEEELAIAQDKENKRAARKNRKPRIFILSPVPRRRLFRYTENNKITDQKLLVVTADNNSDLYKEITEEREKEDAEYIKWRKTVKEDNKGIYTVITDKNGAPIRVEGKLLFSTLTTEYRIDNEEIIVKNKEQAKKALNAFKAKLLSSTEQIFLPILGKSKGIAQLEAKIPGTQLRPSFNVLGRIADTLRNVPLFLSKVGIIGESTIAPKGKLYTRTPGGNYIDLIPRNINQEEINKIINLLAQAVKKELGEVTQSVESATKEIEKLIFLGVKKEGADQFTLAVKKNNIIQIEDKEYKATDIFTQDGRLTPTGEQTLLPLLNRKKVHVNNAYDIDVDFEFEGPTLTTGEGVIYNSYKEFLLQGETPMFGTDLVTMDNVQFKNQYLNYENNVTVDEKLAPNPVPTTKDDKGNLVVTSTPVKQGSTTDTKADIERRRQEIEDFRAEAKEDIGSSVLGTNGQRWGTIIRVHKKENTNLTKQYKLTDYASKELLENKIDEIYNAELAALGTDTKADIERKNILLKKADLSKAPEFAQKAIAKTVESINEEVRLQVIERAYEGITATPISKELGLTTEQVRSIRTYYGVPDIADKTDYQIWKKNIDAELAVLNNKEASTRAKEEILNSIPDQNTEGLKRLKEKASSKRALTEREISWFKTKFPNIPIEVVKGLIDGEAFGKFLSAGKVLLSDEATNGTLYHEAFHAVTQLYLSKKQIDALYKEAGEKLGTTDRLTIEEHLAEDFFKYKETGKILGQRPQRNTIFRKILDFIRALFRLDAKSIEEVYNRLDKGYYTNKDIVGVREFSTLNKLAGKSVAYSKQVLDAIDAIFFERAFVNNLTPDEALDKSSALLASTHQEIKKRAKETDNLIALEAYIYILQNWKEVSTTWQKRAAAIGIEIDLNEDPNKDQDEEAKGRDTAYGEANQVSAKSTLSSASKLLIRSLKQKNADGTDKLSDLNLPQVVEFGNTYNFLLKELSGLSSYSDIYNKVVELSKTRPEFIDLKDRIGKEGTATSQEKFIFQQQFRQDFAKNQVNSHTTVIEADGKIYIIENNKQSRIDKIREGWKNASRGIAKQVTTGQLIIEPSKELLGLSNIKFLHAIGIDFSTETLPEVQDSQLITDTVEYIKAYIKEKNGDVTDLFSTKYGESPVSGRIDSLLELEAEFNPNVTELSYMSTEGKTIYSIGLNSMLSIIKNAINNTRANKEQIAAGLSDRDVLFARLPHLNTVGTEGSLWFSKLFSKDGFRREGINLELDLHDGLKTNNIKGGEFKQSTKGLSIGDKYVQEITSILMDGRSSYLRASDKSTEATFRLTKYAKGQKLAIPIADLAKGFDIQSVKEIFRGYFKSELKRIALFEIQGLGANIDVFGNTTDKDGKQVGNKGAKFTVFEGILDAKLKKSIYEQIQVLKIKSLTDKALEDKIKTMSQDKTLDAHGKLQLEETKKELERRKTGASVKSSETELGVEIDNLYKQVQSQVDADVIKYFDTYTTELLGKIKEFKVDTNGISRELYKETEGEVKEKQLEQLIRAVAINDYINSIEQTKLFIGDMAFYKDLFKRTAGATGTKETSSTGENIDNWLNANNTRKDKKLANGKINVVIYEDVVVASSYVEEYKKALIDVGYSPEEADILLEKYKEMEEGDAQGWITLDELKEFALRRGVRDPKLYAAIDKSNKQIWKDGKLTNKETLLTKDEIASIHILKAQYFGPQELNGLFAPAYHKYSLLPLVPQLVQGRNLEVMLNHMTANQNGYSLFKSGSKVGTPTNAEGKANSFYNENGEINTGNLQKQTIFYDFLGLQVKSSNVKDTVTFGTQFRKLLFSNAFGFGEEAVKGSNSKALLDEYNKIIDEIVEAAKAKLIKNLGINPASGKIEDAAKLIALLRKEAEDRNLPDNIIDFLNTEIVDGLTVVENKLDASVNIAKINSMITSLVNTRLIKQKMNGDALIQVSSSGMESIGKRNIKEDKTYKFYTQNEDGTITYPAECAIPITGQYAFLLEQYGTLEDVNQAIRKGKIKKEILELVGYRIPTQGMNSIEYLTIKEFLPADSATAIILPSEIVAKSGGDFDVDKLNIFKPNLQFRNGEVVYVTKQSREQIGELYDLLKQRAINKELKKTDAASDKLLSAILGTDVTVLSEEDIYEILEEEKLPTNKEEFIKNFNHNKSRQNRIIEIAKQQISHPSNFTALFTPNSTKILTDVVNDFRYYTDYLNRDRKENKEVMTKEEYLKSLKDNLSNIRYSDQLKLTTKIDQFHKFLLAKEMIGIAATANTHHILAQMVGMTLNPTYTVGGEKVSVKINLYDKSIGEELNIGRIKDAEGKHNISEVISQIINATVDAAKDPFFFDLNMSMETLGTQLYLIRLGVPYENVAYFMKQPIITDYLKALAINKSGFLKGTKGAVLNNTQLEESIKKKYLSKEEREGLTSKILTTENLRSLLLKENQKSKEFNETQIQVLEDFLAYKEQSQILGAAAKATNMDTAGLGKDIAVSERKITEILSVKEIGFVNNIDDVLQKTMIKSFNQHQFAIDVFSPLYHVQGSKKAVATRNAIMGTLNPFGAENTNKLSTLIDNDFINYVVQNYGYLDKEDNSAIEEFKKKLFTGENTPAKKLLDLRNKLVKEPNEQKLVNNMLIKELFPIIRNADRNQDNIKIYLKRYDTFTANQLTEAFREVGEIDLPLAKELYKELMDLGILQSGLNNSPITYLGILPQEYYAKIVKNAFKQFDKKSGVEDYKAYQQLFFRNNYSNSLVNNYAYKTGIKELGEGMFGKDYNKALYAAPATSVNTNNNKEGIQEISKDYGVVQVETNPTKELTQKFVDLIAPQVMAQTYKENKGTFANEMFHYGLMWARHNTKAKPVKIDAFDGGKYYSYHELDQKGNQLPPITTLQPIIDEIQSKLGLDMSDYDSVIGNIYVGNQYVYPHKDTTESKSARNYPVVVYTIGNNAGLGIVDNNKGKMTWANQYDNKWLPSQDKLKGYTNELVTHNGSIYTFGLDGNGRFELTHSTPINSDKTEKYPPLTLPNGEIITNYTITLTFRRAQDLEENTPKTPARTTPVVTNNTYTPTSKEVTEKPSDTQFSYKGKTINTEFKLGEEQEQALKDLIDFVDSGNKNHKESDIITLQGAAGTGKTSIIGYLEKYYKGSYSFAYLAPTHAATAELAFATVKSGNTVLPSTLMSSLTVNPRTKKSVFSAKIAKRLGFNPVVVVDESSMLDIQDINKLKEAIENVGGKLIYLGDEKQISKVVQGNVQNKSVSPAFTNFRQLSLTKIFRQSENSLLTLLSKMREQKSFKLFQVPNNESVKFLNRKEYNKELIKDLQTNSENTMIISYTNNAVKDLNDAARKVLGREGETKVGDIIVGYLGYASKQVEKADIANSINYTISNITTNGSVKTIEAKSSKLAKLIALGIKGIKETAYTNYYQLSSDDSLTFDDLTEKDFDSNNSDVSRIFKRVHEATTEYQNKTIGYGTYLDILAATSETLRKYSVGADYIYNPATNRMEKLDKNKHQSIKQNGQGSLLFSKDVDYGHAITIHKSQGSTIDNVYFDTSSLKAATNTPIIDSEGNQITTEKMSLAYVAMSRSKNKLVISIEDNDFEMLQVLKEAKAPVTKQEEQPYIVNEGESEDDETTESTQQPTSKGEVKPGVSELFESNPELANSVYEAAGFKVSNSSIAFNKINNTKVGESVTLFINNTPVEYKRASENYFEGKQITKKQETDFINSVEATTTSIEEFIEREGTKVRYSLDELVNFYLDKLPKVEITPQQKQQALQQYSQYLDTIFPNSKVKDIVYHGTRTKFDKFDKSFIGKTLLNYGFNGFGFYFDRHRKNAIQFMKVYRDWENKTVVVPAILNMTNPKLNEDFTLTGEESRDKQKAINYTEKLQKEGNDGVYTEQHEEYVVFEPEQIHILGSKQDIQGFKKFVTQPSTSVKEGVTVTKGTTTPVVDTKVDKTITYTPIGKTQQTYTVKGSKIFNSKGVEVFAENSKDRNKIFANLAVQDKKAVVVEYKDKKYVVNKKGNILSVATGDIMKWTEENGNRKDIMQLANDKFESTPKNYKFQLDELMAENQGLPADYQEKVAELIKNSKVTNDEELGDLKNKICNIGFSL